MNGSEAPTIGIVVIGRNEGERLKRCISSIDLAQYAVVYVDSGSTDGSVDFIKSVGVDLVELDMTTPFTAGRARNEGFKRLVAKHKVDFVQFVDGDCFLEDHWLQTAYDYLTSHSDAALVCGVRKEIHPDASVFNALCDVEWDGPKGEIHDCGGDFMIRRDLMEQVDGFDPTYIAGEEPELCFRIRLLGWKIIRLDVDMTYHDANITKISQWWNRASRSGHAYTNIAFLNRHSDERIFAKETISILMWGFIIPVSLIVMALLITPIALLGFGLYGVMGVKVYKYARNQRELPPSLSFYYTLDIVLGKFPHAMGAIRFLIRYFTNRNFTLIEYK